MLWWLLRAVYRGAPVYSGRRTCMENTDAVVRGERETERDRERGRKQPESLYERA